MTTVVDLDRRQQILHAALRVFTRDGYYNATLKKIAVEAGIKSPGLVYWYFANKQELFQAIFHELSPLPGTLAGLVEMHDQPVDVVLTFVARRFFSMLDNPTALRIWRLFISDAARHPEVGEQFAQKGPAALRTALAAYLEHQASAGKISHPNPASVARAFMGALGGYMIEHELFPSTMPMPSPEEYARDVVAVFVAGLHPPNNGAVQQVG